MGKFEKLLFMSDLHEQQFEKMQIMSDVQEQYSLLHLADRRAETWFRIAMAGWASAIVFAAIVIWMTVIWP